MKNQKYAKEIIRDFLEMSDYVYVQKLEDYVSILEQISLDEIILKIEQKTKEKVPREVREYLVYDFKTKLEQIETIIYESKLKESSRK